MPSLSKNLAWAMVIVFSPMIFGLIVNYPSPTAKEVQALHGVAKDSFEWSMYNAVAPLCAIAGPTLTNTLLRVFRNSRKKTVFTIDCLGVASWLLNCVTKLNIWAGIGSRACLGLVMGALSAIGPLFLVEIAPEGESGFFGSLNQLFIVVGVLISCVCGASMSYFTLNFVGAVCCLLQAVLIWFIPESPAVERINAEGGGTGGSVPGKSVSICRKKYLIGVAIGVLMMVFQQFSGCSAIGTNLATLMSESGLKEINENYQAAIATSAQFFAVIVGALIVDRLGVKLVWIMSSAGCMIALAIYAFDDYFRWNQIGRAHV